VGNHPIYGTADTPVLLHELYLRGFRTRGLRPPGPLALGAGALMERYGHVRASPRWPTGSSRSAFDASGFHVSVLHWTALLLLLDCTVCTVPIWEDHG